MLRITQIFGAGLFICAASTVNAGIYIGAGLGSDSVDFKENAHVFSPGNFNVINKTHLSSTGVFGTLFLGYGYLHNNWYLAGEVNGNISSTSSKTSNDEFVHLSFTSTTLKIKNSYGFSVLPGYQYTPYTLFYGRLGLQNSEIQERTSDISLANFDSRKNGFRYGVGMKQVITNRLAVRIDYSLVNYNSILSSTFDPVGGVTKNTNIYPMQQLIEFGLVMNFDEVKRGNVYK